MAKVKKTKKIDNIKIAKIMDAVEAEFRGASSVHPKFHSCHEGYAVILEELDELWAEVMKKAKLRDKSMLCTEAIQVAAMAVRFIHDLT